MEQEIYIGDVLQAEDQRVGGPRVVPLAESVLRLIWKEEQISRAEVARRLDLARSTVSKIVNGLLESGLVSEAGTGQTSGGRPPVVLRFENDAFGILGVDIGATHVAVCLSNLRGKIIEWREEDFPVRADPEGTWALVVKMCDDCLGSWDQPRTRLLRIGVAIPSPVDTRNPDRVSEVIMPEWRGKSRLDRLAQRYQVPVHLDNDANLGALAEHWWGAGRGVADFIFIKMAHGVGAGCIFDGEIYRGSAGVAGEIGHLPIDLNGKKCTCGLRGCLGTFVGAHAVITRANELLEDYPESELVDKEISLRSIEDAALAGDELSIKVASEVSYYLGVAVAGLHNLVNPGMVVFGGSLSRLGEVLLKPLRETVHKCTLLSSVPKVRIRTSELGFRAVALGAVTVALDAAFADPRLYQT